MWLFERIPRLANELDRDAIQTARHQRVEVFRAELWVSLIAKIRRADFHGRHRTVVVARQDNALRGKLDDLILMTHDEPGPLERRLHPVSALSNHSTFNPEPPTTSRAFDATSKGVSQHLVTKTDTNQGAFEPRDLAHPLCELLDPRNPLIDRKARAADPKSVVVLDALRPDTVDDVVAENLEGSCHALEKSLKHVAIVPGDMHQLRIDMVTLKKTESHHTPLSKHIYYAAPAQEMSLG